MMACFIATLAQVLLLGFIGLTTAKTETCQIYAAVGDSVTLPFNYEGLTRSHTLRWTHDSAIIFLRQQGRVTIGKQEDITTTGSILLKSVTLQSAGSYRVNALHANDTLAKSWTGQLCVMEKVTKPRLSYVCDTSAVKLNCDVIKPQELTFSWMLEQKMLPSETRQTLSISLGQIKEDSSFSCSVANKVSSESSETVQLTCKAPTLCFKAKTVLGVLAGGAGLIIILLIIIAVLCCSNRNTNMQLSDRGEFKMLSVNKQEAGSVTEYENIHIVESCPSPSPQPSPRARYYNISNLDAETESKAPQLSTAAEEQRHSPVPKPRTKNVKTQNI